MQGRSVRRRVNPLKRNDASYGEERLHIFVRPPEPGELCSRVETIRQSIAEMATVELLANAFPEGAFELPAAADGFQGVPVLGHLRAGESDALLAARGSDDAVGQVNALAGGDGDAAAHVRQSEGGLAVSSIGGAEEGKQGCILGNRQQRPLQRAHPCGAKLNPT